METIAIHRRIERLAAAKGDAPALIEGDRVVTYRALNQRANAVARRLTDRGFRRGDQLLVRKARSIDTIITLLAVLKAGGVYQWLERDEGEADTVTELLRDLPATSANLPVMVRASEPACMLTDSNGAPHVVTHANASGLYPWSALTVGAVEILAPRTDEAVAA